MPIYALTRLGSGMKGGSAGSAVLTADRIRSLSEAVRQRKAVSNSFLRNLSSLRRIKDISLWPFVFDHSLYFKKKPWPKPIF